MPNVKDLRRRIVSVKNTQQITKAMKMIATVKLRNAQDQILACRPYAQELISVIANLAAHGETERYPLLSQRPEERVHMVVITANRGLCGSYNTSILRQAEKFAKEQGPSFKQFRMSFIGRKAREYFKNKLKFEWIGDSFQPEGEQTFSYAIRLSDQLMASFIKGEFDRIYFLYNEFKSAISQKVILETLLPVAPAKANSPFDKVDYLYEPSRDEVLELLLPKYVHTQVYRILLEAIASEHGARLTAMDNATRNADDMISALTLQANRLRQAVITKELIEIVSGAEALKG